MITRYHCGERIQEDEVGGARDMNWEKHKWLQGFGWGNLKDCDQFEDLGIDEDHIKMNVKEMEREGVVWFYVAQVKSKWRAVVNTVMNLRIDICALLRFYAAKNSSLLLTFRNKLSLSSSRVKLSEHRPAEERFQSCGLLTINENSQCPPWA